MVFSSVMARGSTLEKVSVSERIWRGFPHILLIP